MGRGWFRPDFSFSEANLRIESWFRKGYVIFSDCCTKSTHLRRVDEPPALPAAPSAGLSPFCAAG
jgi:hypothetical protein